MKKKLIVMFILIASMVFSAINPFPAKLFVWNKTEDNVFIRLSYHGSQKYFFTVTDEGNTDTYHFSLFEVARYKYDAEITACKVIALGTLDLTKNVKLTFTPCLTMSQWWKPLYWGEPGMEKPNFYFDFDNIWKLAEWKLQYELPVP